MATKIVILLLIVTSANALRVLVMFPIAAKSHNILGQGVVKLLHDAGHEVVYVTSFPRASLPPRIKEVDVSSIHEELNKHQSEKFEKFKLRNLIASKVNIADSPDFFLMVHDLHKRILEHQHVRDLLNDPRETFDVAIIEWLFSETFAGIPAVLQCPLIWLGTTEAHGPLLKVIDEIANPSYNADLFSSRTPPFSFLERGAELWTAVKNLWYTNYHIIPLEKALYSTIFSQIHSRAMNPGHSKNPKNLGNDPDSLLSSVAVNRGVSLPAYEDMAYNASFLFLNSHPSVGTPFRLPQNAKYVAGYHIDTEVKALPQHLQKLFDESKSGVIYFSMGSNLQSSDMTADMKKSLLKMFGTLKQTVLWKFEGDLENVPENVHLVKWAPQQSILAHKNLKFFITHGGQLSTTEAIHFGVPVIGLPLYADQNLNMRAVERKGFGILVQMTEDVADGLSIAIDQMLKDSTYTATAKRLSTIYHHRPISPGAEVVHWTEHVVKTHGAPHLRSPALMMSWYEKIYLDYIVLVIILFVYLVRQIKSYWYRRIRSGKVSKRMKNK